MVRKALHSSSSVRLLRKALALHPGGPSRVLRPQEGVEKGREEGGEERGKEGKEGEEEEARPVEREGRGALQALQKVRREASQKEKGQAW